MRITTCIVVIITTIVLSVQSQTPQVINRTENEQNQLPESRERVKIDYLKYINDSKSARDGRPFTVTLPVKGVNITFVATQNDVIDAEFRRDFPEINTFDLLSTDGRNIKGALTLSTAGLFATILNMDKMVSIYPEDINHPDYHMIEYGSQPDLKRPKQFCGHDHTLEKETNNRIISKGNRQLSGITIGDKRYNYRVAIVTTGEFYQKNGNNDNAVRTVVINSVNAISAIFNNDMSFRLTVGSRIYLDYRDPAIDPFIPDDTGGPSRTEQAGTIIPMHFTAGSFDIGHVFHSHADGDGWSSGGVAQLQSVCDNSTFFGPLNKASAWSGSFDNTSNGWIQLAAHEFGHQFGANHTFNGIGESCTTAIRDNNSYEIGSGTTIMSYNGICDPGQNIIGSGLSDNYFHIRSLEEMYQYVYNGEGGSCGGPVIAPNPLPTVDANPCQAIYNLPKSTPFYLKAKGEWTDGDSHTFCWEQIDEDGNGTPTHGFIGNQAGNSAIAPLFRSYPPTPSDERYFPNLAVLISVGSDPFDVLPNVAREINFNVTLRDNNPSGGAVANDNIKINVANSGPFVITRPAGGEILQAGVSEIFSWNTNGSNSLCSNMRIKLSMDGGATFPIVLAENIPYSAGTFTYTFPSNFLRTTKARVMMECMDYDCFKFFNISSVDFIINSSCTAENSLVCPVSNVSLGEGDPGLNLSMSKVVGSRLISVIRPVHDNLPLGQVAVKGVGGVGCSVVSNYYYNRVNIYVAETGTYTFNLNGSGFASIFRINFNPASACNSFVTSSATDIGGNSISRSSSMTAQLTQCTEYVLVFYSFS
ncbi:MAG: hypothetical protein H7X99_11320, partial [Saprospiraceae bacterium]|nr:hypothetical protein [Saprospiraceae bacterium]